MGDICIVKNTLPQFIKGKCKYNPFTALVAATIAVTEIKLYNGNTLWYILYIYKLT